MREGNVLSRVCLFAIGEWVSHVTITHYELDLTLQPPGHVPPPSQTWDFTVLLYRTPSPNPGHHPPPRSKYGISLIRDPLSCDIWWPSLETYSNLFTSGPPSPLMLTSGGYWKMCKGAVRILLECFLVLRLNFLFHIPSLPFHVYSVE